MHIKEVFTMSYYDLREVVPNSFRLPPVRKKNIYADEKRKYLEDKDIAVISFVFNKEESELERIYREG